MRVVWEADSELSRAGIIAPTGRLDAHGASQFWEQVEGRITEERPFALLDLSGVEFLSSAGVGMLIRLLTRVQQMGGSLATFGANPRLAAILKVVSLEPVLNVRDDVDAARTRLGELGAS